MLPGLNGNARRLAAFVLAGAALLAATPSQLLAGPTALKIVDDGGFDDGAGPNANSEAERPAQRQPETDEPSEDGTDGTTGGNAAEPPAGCLFRDGPLELVV